MMSFNENKLGELSSCDVDALEKKKQERLGWVYQSFAKQSRGTRILSVSVATC